jgi:beta-1,2-mannobiose phosphorylase / 1,2-beta-oligomannan phosphorylase
MRRLEANPLITPEDLEPTHNSLEVISAHNPAAVKVKGEYILMVRVGERAPGDVGYVRYIQYNHKTDKIEIEGIRKDDPNLKLSDTRGYFYKGQMLLTSMSHLRTARSHDGIHFSFDPQPAIFPSMDYEAFGCEDPRITQLEGKFWITYTAVSNQGVTVALASTKDFVLYEKHGIIFPPFQKDVCLFPEKVNGMFVCRHRPYKSEFNPASIWTAYSPDLFCWGRHAQTLRPTPGTWEAERVGCGAPPIRTNAGWLEIYHASDTHGRYCLGAMLSDLEHPERVLSRSTVPVLEPETNYEIKGSFDNCIFSNGLIVEEDGRVIIYYGAADKICAAALTTVDEMVEAAKS